MPFTDISADQISGGAFTDTYTIDGEFVVGNTAGAHVVVGADSHGADGLRLYGPDGVTVLVDLRADTGAANFAGTVTVDASVAGSALNAAALLNLVMNGNMEDRNDTGTAPALWISPTGSTLAYANAHDTLGGNGSLAVQCATGVSNRADHSKRIPVTPGESYYATAQLAVNAAGTANGDIYVNTYNAAGAYIGTAFGTAVALPVAPLSTRVAVTFVVPAGTAYIDVGVEFTAASVNGLFCIADNVQAVRQLPVDAVLSGTIAGEFIVGNPAGAHVVVGSDGSGADGVRLYAADGVTPLIDLNIAGTPSILVQSAATGARVVIDTANNKERVKFYTGDADEAFPGYVGSLVLSPGTAARKLGNILQSPQAVGNPSEIATIELDSGANDGSAPRAFHGNTAYRIWTSDNPLALAAGWSNFGAGFAPARYYRDGAGVVHVTGVVKNTSGGTLPVGTVIGTISGTGHLLTNGTAVFWQIMNGSAGDVGAHVDVNTAGQIILQAAIPNNGWVSLDGISYYTMDA